MIEDPLAEELLRLRHGPGDTVVVEVVEGEIKMHLVSKSGRRDKGERKEKAEAAAAAPSE